MTEFREDSALLEESSQTECDHRWINSFYISVSIVVVVVVIRLLSPFNKSQTVSIITKFANLKWCAIYFRTFLSYHCVFPANKKCFLFIYLRNNTKACAVLISVLSARSFAHSHAPGC